MTARTRWGLAGLLVLLALLGGCAPQHDADESYYLVSANIQVPYWQAARAGFLQAAAQMKLRAEFVGPDTYDPKAQQLAFEKLLQSRPSGILVSPANPELMRGDIDAAIAAGIPVITIDSDSPDSKRLLFIGTNNYQAGVMAAKVAAGQMRGKGNVVIFTMPGQANLDDRLRGYRDVFASYPGMKIVSVVDIRGDPRIAFDATEQMIGKKQKVDGFVCLEALAGKEVANVLDRYHVTGKTVVAMDTDPDTLQWIKKGVIAATVAQKPYTMAYVGLKMLDDLHHHRLRSLQQNWAEDPFSPLPAFVDTGASLIDRNNVDAFLTAEKSATTK
ncbi:MAG TPA: substrate-binding domain-containing protein [Terriglobales bacterium]|nr:substrate-binding domain-containing protein [Terriglobales bacterium]